MILQKDIFREGLCMKKKIVILIVLIIVAVLIGITFVCVQNHNSKKNNVANESTENVPKNYVQANNNISANNMNNEIYSNNEGINDSVERSINNVTMTIKDGSLSSTGATVIITDNNESPFTYGKWFKIDKKENGEWINSEEISKEYIFTSEGYALKEPGNFEMKVDWSELYGSLKLGNYRIVKEVYDTNGNTLYFSCEFTIK